MNTKKLFMLLAAVLLMSTNARAQISEAELQKADVNGDGNVDVADITGIIDIMKNLGHPDGVYKYYLEVVTEEQITDQAFVDQIFSTPPSEFNGKPSSMEYLSSDSNDKYMFFAFETKMGELLVIHSKTNTQTSYGSLKDAETTAPDGFSTLLLSDLKANGGSKLDLIWQTPTSNHPGSAFGYPYCGLQYQDGDVNDDGVVDDADLEMVRKAMKKDIGTEGVKYAMLFITDQELNEKDMNGTLSAWIEEQLANATTTYQHRPSKITLPQSQSSEAASWIWVYPKSLGNVKGLWYSYDTPHRGTAEAYGWTPPSGYDFYLMDARRYWRTLKIEWE